MAKKGPNKKNMVATSPAILKELGKYIRESRRTSGMPRCRICEALDISNSQLSTWENGGAEPRFVHLIRLCSILKMSFERILAIYSADSNSSAIEEVIAKYGLLRTESKAIVASIIDSLIVSEIIMNNSVQRSYESITDKHSMCIEEHSHTTGNDNSTVLYKDVIPERKGRGRPRKSDIIVANTTVAQKRHRGRPRKNPN